MSRVLIRYLAFVLMFTATLGMRQKRSAAKEVNNAKACFYKDAVFPEEDIITKTERYPDGNGGYQFIDIWTAKDDPRKNRPAIMLIHGGSFSGGNRTSNCGAEDTAKYAEKDKELGTNDAHWCADEMPMFIRKLTQLGYVVFSIDYKLLLTSRLEFARWMWNVLISKSKNTAALAAARDARAAIRWIKRHSDQAGIDINPSKIIMMGDSAGAITTLWANYRTEKVEPDTTQCCCQGEECRILDVGERRKSLFYKPICPPEYPNHKADACEGHRPPGDDGVDGSVAAAVSISGGMSFVEYGGADWTDSICCPASQPPLLVVHSPDDSTISYSSGKELVERAKKVGLDGGFITVSNGGQRMKDDGHSPYAYVVDSYPGQQELFFDDFKGKLMKVLELDAQCM